MRWLAAVGLLAGCVHAPEDYVVIDGHKLLGDVYQQDIDEISALAVEQLHCARPQLKFKVLDVMSDPETSAQTIEVSGCEQSARYSHCVWEAAAATKHEWIVRGDKCPPR